LIANSVLSQWSFLVFDSERITMQPDHGGMPGRIENPMQLFRGTQFAGLLTKHFRRTEAVVIALTMGPMLSFDS
jgi:hypothetical protein